MAVDHLFSIPLGKYKLPNFAEVKEKFVPSLIKEYREADEKNRHADNWKCNSYQTWMWGNGQEELSNSLFPFIDEYLNGMGFSPFSYQLESWFNVYGKQQFQESHAHNTSLLAGMLVLNYDKEQHTPIVFRNPWMEYARTFQQFECSAMSPVCTDSTSIILEEGHIYLWLSSLGHLVPPQPNTLKDLRITFTFNVNPDNKWDSINK